MWARPLLPAAISNPLLLTRPMIGPSLGSDAAITPPLLFGSGFSKEPSGTLADRAATAVTEHAADEHFGARFSVREEARPDLYLCVRLEQLVRERRERAL